jgi:5-methylcytosine-specific restriction protein A
MGKRSIYPQESAAKRGYGWEWQKRSSAFIAKNPLCALCDPAPVLGEVVDHKVPHRLLVARASGDEGRIAAAEKLFWDESNWQTLCASCHNSKKQRLEKTGRIAGTDINGRPIDPNHHWNKGYARPTQRPD